MVGVIDDIAIMDTITFFEKVSDIATKCEVAAQIHLKKVFEDAFMLSDKKACLNVAILHKWNNLAAYFSASINGEVENG